MEKQFIDIAYDVARTKYNKKAFTFEHLWTDFVKKAKLDAEEQKQAGEVYTAMLQDPRFIFIGKGQWKLREFLTLEEQAELSNALYDFSTETEQVAKESDEEASSYYGEEDRDEMYDEAKQKALDDTDEESDEEEDEESQPDEEDEEEEQ